MKHLVESHLGYYYISDSDLENITKPCDQCGDCDWVIFSWDESLKKNKLNAFLKYFSIIKETKETINNMYCDGIGTDEIIDYLLYKYSCDEDIIIDLLETKQISEKEGLQILKQISLTKKEQFRMLKEMSIFKQKLKVKKLLYID